MKNYERDVLALSDTDLELFVRQWVASKKGYFRVTTFSGPGDHGRDVVGFMTASLHDGPWHNYQCKQYGKALPTETALNELGKILYFASEGEFSVPASYAFVAPRGVNRNLAKLLFSPASFKEALTSNWASYCATKIVDGKTIALGLVRLLITRRA